MLGILRLSQTHRYACSTLAAPSCGRIVKLACLLWILQASEGADHDLFAFRGGVKCSSSWSLPGPQLWDGFLHMLTSGLQNLALATVQVLTHGASHGVGLGWVRHRGCPWAIWGDPQVRHPQCLVGKPPCRSHEMVSIMQVSLICSVPGHSFCFPSHVLVLWVG